MLWIMRICLLLALAMTGVTFAAFVAPAEGPVPFRRDKLPVDVATMTGLSSQLVTLAEFHNGEGAELSRTRAQILALAVALDPANRRARDLIENLAQGELPDAANSNAAKSARSRAWTLLGWLSQPAAGDDGQALGACLSDVLSRIDPEHPEAAGGSEERGAWQGWVAARDAFDDDPEPGPMADGEADEESDDEDDAPEAARLVLKSAACGVPTWVYYDKTGETRLESVQVKANGWTEGDHGRPQIEVKGLELGPLKKGFDALVHGALESRHGSLPAGMNLVFRFELAEDTRISSRNDRGLTAAMVLAADALLTGVEPEAEVLAGLGEDLALEAPVRLWQTLREMAASKATGRLILPAAAKDFLPPLVTLDQAEFFMNREVLIAEDLDQLIKLASSAPPPAVVEAHQGYAEVQEARGTRSLGSFLQLDSVRSRLAKVREILPEHASAAMLGLRGTSKWPRRLERPIYAREIRAALVPLRGILTTRADQLKVADLQSAEDQCRERLKEIEMLADSVTDRSELHDPAANMVKTINGLVSDIRRADEYFRVDRAVQPVIQEYVAVLELLSSAAGDLEEYPIPFRERRDR